jgi:type IV secretion system protein VirB10
LATSVVEWQELVRGDLMRILPAILLVSTLAVAQQSTTPDVNPLQTSQAVPALSDPKAPPIPAPTVHALPAAPSGAEAYTLAAGTHIAVTLKHAITTRSARENDPVYAETSFPVVSNGRIVIPVGTYVQGVIQRAQRPGRVKGRGELLIHFNSLIFPSGYTLLLPGAIDNVPGADKTEMKDKKEGAIESQGTKGKDVGTVASTVGTGAAIGAMSTGTARGAGIGGLAGAGVGLASVLLTRGPDVRIESGTLVDMVLEREIVVQHERVGASDAQTFRIVH